MSGDQSILPDLFRLRGPKGRRGNLLVLVLIIMAWVGGIASRLVSNAEVQQTRKSEEALKVSLAEIRHSFDVREIASPGFDPDLSNMSSIRLELASLQNQRFLHAASVFDLLIPAFQWNSTDSHYWRGVGNISANSSFESEALPDPTKSEIVASWSFGTPDTIAASDTKYFPSQNSEAFDDYHRQNKLGRKLRGHGSSLRIGK